MSLSAGDRLGPYQIVSNIGAGGMGEVYKAVDTRLGRTVAIKTLNASQGQRFEQEARAIAALNHPNICVLHDIGPDYLVMEHIEGEPLSSRLAAGAMPLDEALKLAGQIADALDAAHSKGILHRDLKPANIMITGGSGAAFAKLLDFGLAKHTADTGSDVTQTQAGTVMGTAAYMSPEQAQALPVDTRSDIFSFGSVLYEMLSGKRAFAGGSMFETLNAVVRHEPVLPQSPASGIVGRCLAKLPAQRFQSMAELKAALQQLSTQTGSSASQPMPLAPVTAATPSIAVLPFANMSSDKENEYFSDGLAEEILNLLAKIPNLKVIARTSSFAFRGKEQDITKIAETLRVQNILEGSVRKAGNRVRITAQLINAADGSHLWSERYDRDMTDVFAIQDEISQAISEELQVRLAPHAKPVNLEAYQLYLKGQYHKGRYTPASMAKAKECFEQALAIDPNYAPAYSGLAAYYGPLAVLGMKPADEVVPLVKAAAEKALAIDPNNSEAHSILATMAGPFDYDWNAAVQHHNKAMAAGAIPEVRRRYAIMCLLPLGRVAEAIEQGRLALETDPLCLPLHEAMVFCLTRAKQYTEAIEYARRSLEIDSTFYLLWSDLGSAQLHAGLPQEAIGSLQRTVELAPWFSYGEWLLSAAYHQVGDYGRSQELLRMLAEPYGHTVAAAFYYALTEDSDAMFEALEGALRRRDSSISFFHGDAFFDPYRADPRFQALLRKMNLSESTVTQAN